MSALEYFECRWNHSNPSEPVRFLYEVDSKDNVLRQIEHYADGRTVVDSVEYYDGGATKFGFGTLIGVPFSEIEAGSKSSLGDDELSLARSSRSDFMAAWGQAS